MKQTTLGTRLALMLVMVGALALAAAAVALMAVRALLAW